MGYNLVMKHLPSMCEVLSREKKRTGERERDRDEKGKKRDRL